MTQKNKIIAKILAPLALALVAVLSGCAGGAAGGGAGGTIEQTSAPAMGVSPSSVTVKAGDQFDVNVVLKTINPVRAAGCELLWAGTGKIECVDKVSEGDFFKSAGKTIKIGGDYDAATGTKGQVAVSSLAEKGAKGEGTLVTFHFKAVTPGEVTLKIFHVQVTDLLDKEISITPCNGKVVVQ